MSRSTSKDSKACEDEDNLPSWALIDFRELEIQDRIGGGGIGVIYKGRFRHETVAIKALFDPRINESLKKEFMDELLTMSKIDVASAMEYLHALKPAIIHRDLKSLNVLKAFNGSLKLCDFGLVKVKGSQAGTPSYMAPVDVYAFGVLLWEIFSQDIPWNQVPIADVRERVIGGDRPSIESFRVPSRVGRLIQRCWAQNPEDRPTFTGGVDELYSISEATPQVKHAETIGSGDILDSLLGAGRK